MNGYFAKLKREIRLRIPGSVIFRKVFTLQIKYRAKDLVPESLNELAWVKNEFPSKVPSKNKLVLGIPKLETRGDKWVEGDHFFVMSHQEVFSSLLDFESVLVLSGSPFSHLEPGLRDIYEDHISNPEKRVILIHGDIRYTKPGELESWMEKVHLVVHFNPLYASKVQKHYPKKQCQILIWPGLPFPESFFGEIVAKTRKERGIVFAGADHRSRKSYFQSCENRGLPAFDFSHGRGRSANTLVDYRSYLERLASFELAFTNGYKNSRESIVVGRAIESVLLKTTLLYESGSWINHFLKPYKHYIPVFNHADLAVKCEYFLNNIEIARKIADQAYNHYTLNYSTVKFWSSVNELLLESKGEVKQN